MSAFSFEAGTRRLFATAAAGTEAPWVVCPHLAPPLATLLARGSCILAVTGPGAWTRIDLDVSLDNAPRGEDLAALELAAGVVRWTNTDSHYPLQSGLSCAACRQALSWPLVTDRR